MSGDARAGEAVEHLQTAALELIAAARAFLDLAEELVREPAAAATIVQTAATVGRTVFRGTEPTSHAADSPPGTARVRRIDVS